MSTSPSPNGSNGRQSNGRFGVGNGFGTGNPFAKRAAELRSVLYEAVTEDDLRAVVAKLVASARAGDLAATRELFDRLYGKPAAAVALDVMVDEPSEGEVNHATLRALRQQLLHEPHYLDYLDSEASKRTE